MHRSLKRQLRRCGLDPDAPPVDQAAWAEFLDRVDRGYHDNDQERYLLERSLDISSKEMEALYEQLREKSASQLQAERDRLRGVISSLGAGLCVIDDLGCITAINPEATRILEWTEEDAIGANIGEWFVEDSHIDIAALVAAGDDFRNGNAHMLSWSRRRVPVSYVLSPIYEDGKPKSAVLVFNDMTEIRRAEEELSAARDKAVDSARAKAEFLANMSHEIRTPMSGVIGMADLLLETRLDDEQRDYANTVRSCSNTLLTVINDILDLSKIESGKMPIESKATSLGLAMRETANLMAGTARDKGVVIRCATPDHLPQVMADPVRIRQVLSNLAGNAIKFTDEGEVLIVADVLARDATSTRLRVEVRDTGVGIPADRLDKIFESFTQADGSTARKFGGTGLGLTISRQLIELMGGRIGVESTVGEGSTFWFELELPIAAGAEVEGGSGAVDSITSGGPMRILVAEDNPVNVKIASLLLKKFGYEFDLAGNGEEAIAKMRTGAFDLVLMDIQMPEVDGLEATLRWRAFEEDLDGDSHLPIIAMTANAMAGDRERCLEHGMDDYISKPINSQKLGETLSRWAAKLAAGVGAPA